MIKCQQAIHAKSKHLKLKRTWTCFFIFNSDELTKLILGLNQDDRLKLDFNIVKDPFEKF